MNDSGNTTVLLVVVKCLIVHSKKWKKNVLKTYAAAATPAAQ